MTKRMIAAGKVKGTKKRGYLCPKCGHEAAGDASRRCPECGYEGDWIHPGKAKTYAQEIGRCPCQACLVGAPERCYMTSGK